MNHSQLVTYISNHSALKKAEVERVLSLHASAITDEVKANGKITLHDIGTITVVETPARPSRNPQTGEAIEIPAGKRIKLKAAKALKDAVA
ncbi:MAG: hypothetical protein BVN35_09495 [Proteobacteria bacterium ST_bin11]|nr:MAG: hypothetical protein BVN35_09495 [Proteobacteria bacterium ST_bin11]